MEDSSAASEQRIFVYIVESPKPQDLLEGRLEGPLLAQSLKLAKIDAFHKIAVNPAMLIQALGKELENVLKLTGGFPILHFSLHGGATGVELTDGTPLDWNMLRAIFLILNEELRGGLVVCMSSCHGFSACQTAMSLGKLPFYALVGPVGEVAWSDAAVAFMTFYHQLIFKRQSAWTACSAMCTASGVDTFRCATGEHAQRVWLNTLPKQTAPLADAMRRYVDSSLQTSGGDSGT